MLKQCEISFLSRYGNAHIYLLEFLFIRPFFLLYGTFRTYHKNITFFKRLQSYKVYNALHFLLQFWCLCQYSSISVGSNLWVLQREFTSIYGFVRLWMSYCPLILIIVIELRTWHVLPVNYLFLIHSSINWVGRGRVNTLGDRDYL